MKATRLSTVVMLVLSSCNVHDALAADAGVVYCTDDDYCVKTYNIGYVCREAPEGTPPAPKEQAANSTVTADPAKTGQRLLADTTPAKIQTCQHKALFDSKRGGMLGMEWAGTFVFSLIMMLSNVAGIGGGGVAIPLAQLFFYLDLKSAIAVSSFSIMISTLARFFWNFNERHPEKDVTSIDYGLTNVMMPLTMVGSLIGSYILIAFPELIITIILTVLLFVLTIESGRKFVDIYRKESEALAAKEGEGTELAKVEPSAAAEEKKEEE